MTIATKAGLLGMWRIDRRIIDARGPDAEFRGTATFSAGPEAPDLLVLAESGHLTIGDQRPIIATRTYKWLFTSPRLIEVQFANGLPFHSIDLTAQRPTARHDCAPDSYQVEYDFQTPDLWRCVWAVTGPRKDYVMTSVFTRRPLPKMGSEAHTHPSLLF